MATFSSTPEYNHGTSGALKNAIDFLFAEWNNKAAGFVSYGGASGARAVEQLRLNLAEVQMATVRLQVLFSMYHRLRKLQRLQARFTKRDVGQRDARSARRMGRRAEDAPEENSIEDHRCKLA